MFEILLKSALFKGLDSGQIQEMLDKTFHQVKSYHNGEMIAQSGEEVSSLMIIIRGSVRGEMLDFTGKTIKIEDRESPQLLAPAFLFGKNNRYPVNITANEEVSILIFPRESLLELLQEDVIILNNYLNTISSRAQFLSRKIRFLSFQSIKGKIAHLLLDLVKKTGSEIITLPGTQSEMAELFGITRPSLGRSIRELDNEGFIEARGRQIRILDKEGLSGLLR